LIQAVIFDLDGTLVHLPIDYERLFQEFSKIMKTNEVRPLKEKICGLDSKTRKKIFEAWDKLELSALREMTINENGISLYKKFIGSPKALVTMQGKALVQGVVNRLELSFNFAITREDSLDRVHQLQIATQRFETQTCNVLFVGDTEEDYLAAKKVECQFLRVRE
jgi:HAD superfamily hydrolase (TIGR01549 family)